MRRRGIALGSVLLVLAVLVALLFIAASASLSHLQLVNAKSRREHARNLAESALSAALEKLIVSNYTFGKDPKDRVVVTVAGLSDAEGIVTFDSKEFPDAYSTFNLESDKPKVGAGGLNIPTEAVHFVARGRVGDVQQWVECVYHKPPYPDGIVGKGWVEANGLVLTGVKNGEDYKGGDPSQIPDEDKTLANIFSNASSGPKGPAVLLGARCEINGSVGSTGSISIDPSNVVRGEVLPFTDKRPVPAIDIGSRISELLPNSVSVSSTGGTLTLDPSWFNHSPGSLNIGGNLDLNGTALCVQGNLTVGGAIKGTGVILCTGNVEVTGGGSNVVSADQVAIAAAGDVTLRGPDPAGNYFQGLVYSQGDIEASKITVVGAAVADGSAAGKGNILLENVRFVKTPTSVQINLTRMKGYGWTGRAGALSVTLTLAPDGVTYLADVRAAFSRDSDANNADKIDNPILWKGLGDTPAYKVWKGVNVGQPGPNFGTALGAEIGQWAADYTGQSKWKKKFGGLLNPFLNDMLKPQPDPYKLSFSLNNLLAEDFGESRILLWRDFQKK